MAEVILNPQTVELSKKDIVKIPTVIKNKVIMAPGKWNDTHYTSEEIQRAFKNTNWGDKDITSIILDHSDKPLSVHDWVGWIKNPRLIGGNLIGDLELYDENVLIKLLKAKAKFGISPRVKGMDEKGEFRNFTFENFSIVTNPAVKTAYINLSQKLKGGKKMTEKILQEEDEVTEDETEEEEGTEEVIENEEEIKEMAKEKKYPYKYKKDAVKKKKYPYPEEEEMGEEEVLEISTMSDWTDFVGKMRKKYPKMSLKDIAKAYKKKSKESAELEEMGDTEILARLEQLTEILKRRKKYPEEEDKEKEKEKKMKEMEEKINELSQRLNEPDAKSVQELSQTPNVYGTSEQHHSQGVLGMAEFLQKKIGSGGQLV